MLFLSTFKNVLDLKKRVIIPKDFRLSLGDINSFVAFRSHKTSAIDCFSMKKMQALSEKIDSEMDPFSMDRDSLESAVFADAIVMRFDKDGRVVIPDLLLEHAQIEKNIAFVGRGTTFQIWEPELFSIHQAEARKMLLKK